MRSFFHSHFNTTSWLAALLLCLALGAGSCGKGGAPRTAPRAVNGVLDLRHWDFADEGPVRLDGQWHFYFNRLLDPAQDARGLALEGGEFVEVPNSWVDSEKKRPPFGAASYALTILLPPHSEGLMLYQRQVDTAMRLYANGQEVGESGNPALDESRARPQVSVQLIALPPTPAAQLRLLYHTSNYANDSAGIWESIDLGPAAQIVSRREGKLLSDYLLFGALILAAVYHIGLFVSRRSDLPALLFGLFCLDMALRIPVTGETTIHRFLHDLSYEHYKMIDHFLVYVGGPLFAAFVALLFGGRLKRSLILFSSLTALPCIVALLVLPSRSFIPIFPYYFISLLIVFLWLITALILASARRQEGALFSLLGLLFFIATIINDFLASRLIIHSAYILPLGLFVFIFSQAYMLSRLFARAYNTAEKLSLQMQQRNVELQRLDQLKDEFLANTSHELRTPLHGIVGISDSLLGGAAGETSAVMRRNLQLISDSGRRLASLVDDILDFSRLRNRDLELRRRPVDIASAIDVALALSQGLVGARQLRLVNQAPGLYVDADEDRLEQILLNLIGNAIKFTASGEVRIEAGRDPEQPAMIRISVLDTGIGLPEDRLESIFDSFTQADGSIGREYGGAGLGLSITRSLVELHGGKISAHRRAEGGSEFRFTLPAVEAAELSSAAAEEASAAQHLRLLPSIAPAEGAPSVHEAAAESAASAVAPAESAPREAVLAEERPAHILIVDDDPVNLQVLRNHLSMSQYLVRECASGQEALAALQEANFDLILLDVMMPRLSGYEVCRIVRESFSTTELPVILLTARNRVSDLVTGLESGANDYLVKPFDAQELQARVRTLLELKRAAASQSHLAMLQGELAVAHQIQQSLLPRALPPTPGLRIAARYQPMTGLAGDFYDFCPTDDGGIGCIVADVSGHGVPAALVVSMLKVTLWFFQQEFGAPDALLYNMNQALLRNTGSEFVTAAFAWIDRTRSKLLLSNAAHPPVYLLRAADGELLRLKPAGALLAVFPEIDLQLAQVDLAPGDRIVLYTDGVTEAINSGDEMFGEERLEQLLRQSLALDAEQFAAQLFDTVLNWTGDTVHLADDFSFVVIDVLSQDAGLGP
ncbi:MAG: SpoIIE family protein phosphatase [Leptospirales bacterium]|nr:SpoIIE family protein phosphatase [Leptospirales bacterium]